MLAGQGTSASVPHLLRAVAECTQPYGPPASAAAVSALQVYLTDASCVDSVYRAILARACAEPQSEAVIAKCIALVRQCVSRYPPSAAVLSAIATTCSTLAATLPPHSGLQKSLLYLQNSVDRTADSTQGNKRLAKISARSGGSSTSNKGTWSYAAANGDLAASGSSTKIAAAAAGGGGSVHSSASDNILGPPTGKQQQLGPQQPVWGSADQQQQHYGWQQRQQQQQQQDVHDWQSPAADWQQEQQQQLELAGVRTVPAQAVLPHWTFQQSALQELWGGAGDAAGSEEGDFDWSALAPQLSPSLVPLVGGLPGMEQLYTLRCQDIVDAITGGDACIQLRQMQEITEVRRLQAGVTPELLQQTMQQCLAGRGRRLFQPLPYTQQEQAEVQASDVAAVVEVMCGKPSPAAPSAITGAVGLDDPDAYWQPPGSLEAAGNALQQPLLLLYQHTSAIGGPQQQQQHRHVESIGQISSCILIKLIVDLWLTAGGAAALPLVLRMLQQGLYQLQPQYRAQAFDVIYNLSLHGTMLMPPAAHAVSLPPSPALDTSRVAPAPPPLSGALSPLLQQQQQQQVYGATDSPGALDLQLLAAADSYSQQGAGVGVMPSPPQSPGGFAAPQQQQQSPGPPGVSSSWSPQPSPRGRSRLSRSQLAWMAPADSLPPLQQQQQQQSSQQHQQQDAGPSASSSSYLGATGAGAAAPSPAGDAAAAAGGAARGRATRGSMAAVHEGGEAVGEGGDAAGSDPAAAAVVPVEVAWEAWLQQLLFELLLLLAMTDEPNEAVWQSALGCLLHLTTHAGHWVAPSLSQLPPAAAAALLDACVRFHWSSELHAQLVQMAVNLLYLSDHHAAHTQATSSLHSLPVGLNLGPRGRQQQQQQQQEEGEQLHLHERQQQQQQKAAGQWKHLGASAAVLASPEDVAVTLDTVGGSRGLKPHALLLQQQQQQGGSPRAVAAAAAADSQPVADATGATAPASPQASSNNGSSRGGGGTGSDAGSSSSELGQLDLPWQLHAGPVDEQQLAAFGGPAKLLQHFCHAGSVEAQRTLLVPLLQVLMPPDATDMAQLAVLQALGARPSCLAALQAAASAGLPGWSSHVLQAVQQQLGPDAPDAALLKSLLQRVETLSMQRMAVPAVAVTAAGAGAASEQASHAHSADSSSSSADGSNPQQQQQQQVLMQLPPEVQLAVQVTLQQLRGQLPSQPQPQGAQGAAAAYQPPPEVQGAWKALRALIWCDDDLARLASRHWLQQLLAVTLHQSLKGAILLPLPGLQQYSSSPADPASAGSASAVAAAACEAWADVLQQLVVHCPRGSELLVDALQLHMATCKLRVHTSSSSSDGSGGSGGGGSSGGALQQQQQGPQSEQRQRAAAARECVQAWAFVCQWVMQGRVSASQAALTRLAAMAHSISCVFGTPESHADMLGGSAAAAAAAAAEASAAPTPKQQQVSATATAAAAAVDAMQESTGAGFSSREFEAGFRGLAPPEPSAEPSSLAGLWGGSGAAAGSGAWASSRQQGHLGGAAATAAEGGEGGAASAAADAAAAAAAEGVCWPQAFLLGCALLVQQMAQILSGASLALLLVRLLQVKPPSRAADRGFHGRPSSSRALAAAASATGQQQQQQQQFISSWAAGGSNNSVVAPQGVMPCPLLYPWSDGRQDLQLGLVLMLISSCGVDDPDAYTEFGLDAVTQQVLSGCADPRVCLVLSQFVLEHLMQHQQDRYWAALRQLVTAAQQANDERLLGNPFLQLLTLLSSNNSPQQQQEGGLGLGLGLGLPQGSVGFGSRRADGKGVL